MSPSSTIHLEHTSPQTARITFANPPVNVVVSETVVALHKIVRDLDNDPDIQVVVFESGVPDFFFNHYDGADAANLPVPEHEDDAPVWTDMVMRLSKASYVSIASIRGRTRGGGNELALACDLRYASREKAFFSQPEVGLGILPGGGGTERLPRAIGRDRALEAILGSADYDADMAERWGWVTRTLPDTELDAFVDATVARLASFDRQALATAKAMIGRATLPPDADLIASYNAFVDAIAGPALPPRAMAIGALAAEKGLDVEYQLGEYIGQVNQNL
jgi:enoyl-CoA hydratase/carnithine racemase